MPHSLVRTLDLKDLVTIVVGAVIGSGIFLVPGSVLVHTGGSVAVALGVWFFAGILSLLGALTYGELGAMKPEAGGLYAYIRDCFGRLPAFLFGWTQFFVISSGTIAALSAAFARYAMVLFPISPSMARIVSLMMIVAVAAINVRGTRGSADVQNLTTAIKALAIVVLSVALMLAGSGWAEARETFMPTVINGTLLTGAGVAMIAVLWAYEGWQYVTYSAGEARDAQRNFPRAIALGTAGLIVLYMVANLGYIAALGPKAVAASNSVASDAVGALFGAGAAKAVAALILLSIFSAANGIVLSGTRVYYAMARDGVFFHQLAEVHPRFGTPAFAIVASCAWAAVLALTGTFEQLLTYVVFVGWIFYALGALCVFVYRKREPEVERSFRVPGYPLTPLLFVIAGSAIVINTLFGQPVQALLGLGMVLLGTPAYALWNRRRVVVR